MPFEQIYTQAVMKTSETSFWNANWVRAQIAHWQFLLGAA
jgi:hypothetical protein